jgi:hypothetical protein
MCAMLCEVVVSSAGSHPADPESFLISSVYRILVLKVYNGMLEARQILTILFRPSNVSEIAGAVCIRKHDERSTSACTAHVTKTTRKATIQGASREDAK